jgi:hypothetical protein
MSSHSKQDRWSYIAGIAIIATLAVLLLNPSGVVGRWITSTYRGWDEGPSEPEANRSLVPGPSTFDSSELPQLTHAFSVIAGGFFLPDSGIVLVERTEVYFVDMASGETRVFGREGGGPHEFRRIQRALRSPQGIALEDNYRLRVVFLDNSGEFVGDMRYNTVPFKGSVMDAPPVAVHPDGRIVFRDREGKDFGSYRGRTWDAIEYLAVDSAGEVEVVAQAKGSEYYYEAERSGDVFFGHSTLMAASPDRVAIAETDQEAIQVFGWDGGEVGRIPMPSAVRPSRDQVRAVREYRADWPSRAAETLSRTSAELPAQLREQLGDLRTMRSNMDRWPVNELAPPIDLLFVDFDERLWVRDYHFTDQDSVTWRVWDMERFTPLFQVKLAADEELLDARGDVVLLRREDELDVPRAVVSRLVATEFP